MSNVVFSVFLFKFSNMTATFSITSAELNASIIEKIRSLTQGRNFKVTIQVEEEKVYLEEAKSDSQVAEEAVVYTRQVLHLAAQNKEKLESIRQFYARYRVDMNDFKFNREEANER